MKMAESMKVTEFQAASALKALLQRVPALDIANEEHEVYLGPDRGVDFIFDIYHNNANFKLIVEVKRNGQPRHVRSAIWQLLDFVRSNNERYIPILITPYLSPESQAICEDAGVSYLDLMGNTRLAFDAVYIERAVAEKPRAESRALRSIFSPKATQVLSLMFIEPNKEWRVTELAESAKVSLGHVSNVRKALLEREWAEERDGGVALTNPDGLLDVWRENYRRPLGRRVSGYTYLHGSSLTDRLRGVLSPEDNDGRAICAFQTAAQWIAPFERETMHTFYADEMGAERLERALELSNASKGQNVYIRIPRDEGVFRVVSEPAEGIFCTSPLQTYLDLWNAGERSREAAEFLREERLQWSR